MSVNIQPLIIGSWTDLVELDGVGPEPEVADGVDPHEVFLEKSVDQTVQEFPVWLSTHSHGAKPAKKKR